MKKALIVLDVDGVIRNILPAVLDCHNKTVPFPLGINDVKKYDLDFITDKKAFFVKNGERIFRNSPAYSESISAVKVLLKHYEIKFVSAQYEENWDYTIDWFVNHKLPTERLYFAFDKSRVECDVIVDDCPDNLRNHSAQHRFIFDQNYNRDCTEFDRVFSLYHLIHKLGSIKFE
jgi:5'(3')-deoxyribonucleotidase